MPATTTIEPVVTSSARGLLADYGPGSTFLFASPRATLLAEGAAVELPPGVADLGSYVTTVLDALGPDGPPRTAVGALPFDDRAPARLIVPSRLRRGEPRSGPGPAPVAGAALHHAGGSDPAAYTAGVKEALRLIGAGDVQKVVLSRTRDLVAPDGPVDVGALVARLAAADPRSHVFAVDLPGERVLVGASPELLVRRQGRQVTAQPLAGSAPRSSDPVEDGRRAAALAVSAKDRHEHAVVVRAVADALRPFCSDVAHAPEPTVIGNATMWHLGTRVTGTVDDPAHSALVLAGALHPTPAICGAPTAAARDLIAELEPFERGFYGGMVGWVDADGDGEWALTIRCAEVAGDRVRLFAGAGVVDGSDPDAELAETEAKLATMLAGLGVAP